MFLNCESLVNFDYPINIYIYGRRGTTYMTPTMLLMFGNTAVKNMTINVNFSTSSSAYGYTHNIFSKMFSHSKVERVTINGLVSWAGATDYATRDNVSGMFGDCSNLTYVYAPHLMLLEQSSSRSTGIMSNVPANGTIIVSNDDGISAGTNGVPATWTVEYALN